MIFYSSVQNERTNERTSYNNTIIICEFMLLRNKSEIKIYTLIPAFRRLCSLFPLFIFISLQLCTENSYPPKPTDKRERERESVTKSLEQIEIIISCSYIIITTMHAIFFRRNVLRKGPTIERIFRTLLKISVTMENLQKVTK